MKPLISERHQGHTLRPLPCPQTTTGSTREVEVGANSLRTTRFQYWFLLLATVLTSSSWGATAKRSVIQQYHGESVRDDYQWLEQADEPAVRRWSAQQNQRARSRLDRIESRQWTGERLQQLFKKTSANYFSLSSGGTNIFYLEFLPPAQQPVLKRVQGTNGPSRAQVVLDPNVLTQDGSISIDWYQPSRDGSLVAVSMSSQGSELGTLRIYETETGRALADEIPRVHGPTAGGSVCWNEDSTGVYYTRYPAPGERAAEDLAFYQQVFFHRLGTPVNTDRYEVGKEFPRIAEIQLESSPDHRWQLATVANGDGGEFAHFLRNPQGRWSQVTRFGEDVSQAAFGRDPSFIEWPRDNALYFLSHAGAPKGQLLRLPLNLDGPRLSQAQPVIAEGKKALIGFSPSANGIYLSYLDGGPMSLYFRDFSERTNRLVYPRPGSSSDPVSITTPLVLSGDLAVFRVESYTEPFKWYAHDPARDRTRVTATEFGATATADFNDIEVVRAFATSKDGTQVPMNILSKRGLSKDGNNPTILYGYGGYGISLTPRFDVARRVWFDQGGVYVVANLRGGGEYGEGWHRAGNLTRKQNVFDDFAACAEFLIRSNYTRPAKLSIQGGSNGGLLMGALLTQRPELFQAVVSHVGIYDSLRVELDPNGVFNITEFGTVTDPDQYRALRAYSPYHHVRDGIDYPAVLLLTGEKDGRVNPAHSRKMAARLQAATKSSRPILLRTSGSTGHGAGTPFSARVAELADVYSFLFDQLGVFYSRIGSGPWSGGIGPTTATVKAKLWEGGLTTRLRLTEEGSGRRVQVLEHAPSDPEAGNVVSFEISSLKPDTGYSYVLEVNGRPEPAKQGKFRTFPSGAASFRMAFASCARTGSTSEVFDRIREARPLFYMNMGDFHYLNISTNLRSRYREGYDAILASPQQSALYREVPLVYMWDDHDFGGNGSGRSSSSHAAARLTYQEYIPHYPLAAGAGDVPIYQSFSVGRVKFILTDLRSERDSVTNKDNASKSMMGAAQKAWFKNELLSAKGKFPLICWVSTVPWLGQKGSNYYRNVKSNQFGYIHHTQLTAERTRNASTNSASTNRAGRRRDTGPALDEDHWSVYATERREICDFIQTNQISGVCILHGDSHMLAADDGRNGNFATSGALNIPVMCAAPLDQDASHKGGPYSEGVYRVEKGEGAFGLLTINDVGDSIQVSYSGRNQRNEEKIRLKFAVPAPPVSRIATKH